MPEVIFIKGVVICDTVGKLDVNRRESRFQKLKIYEQSACPAVAVDKRMYAFELNMEEWPGLEVAATVNRGKAAVWSGGNKASYITVPFIPER